MDIKEAAEPENNEKETDEVAVSETSPKKKLLPPPFIIYSETNEEFIFDEDEPGTINSVEREASIEAKKNKRRNRRNRHRNKKGLRQELQNLDSLVLPDGVILVEDGTYVGFQCTYCNCVMSSLKTVEEHTGGNPHKQKLRSKAAKGEDSTIDIAAQNQPMPSLGSNDDVSSDATSASTLPLVPNRETSTSLSNSSLSKFLLKTKEPVVGLDHIVEVQLPDIPLTYRCNLCILDCDSDGIKEHIVGTRHRLSYLRVMDTQKIAEMLALNLKKAERNKRTIKYIQDLQAVYGSGTIQVTHTPLPPITVAIETETKASAQPQAAVQPGNNPPITIWSEPKPQYIIQSNQSFTQGIGQKRPYEGGYPPWKRQSTGRGFYERKRYNNRRQHGNYFGRRQSTYYERELNYNNRYQEGRLMNREQYGNKPYERNEQHNEKETNREQNMNIPHRRKDQNILSNRELDGNQVYERSDQLYDGEPNREHPGNKTFERHGEHIDKESDREQYGNKPFERHNQHTDRDSNREQYSKTPSEKHAEREHNRERNESWRSYAEESVPSKPQGEYSSSLTAKHEQHLMMENPLNNEESFNMQSLGPGTNYPPNYRDTGNQSNRRGRGRGGRFNARNRGSSFSRITTNRFPTNRFETSGSSGFSRFGDFGRPLSFRSLLSDPLSVERDRLKMKYPGLRLGR